MVRATSLTQHLRETGSAVGHLILGKKISPSRNKVAGRKADHEILQEACMGSMQLNKCIGNTSYAHFLLRLSSAAHGCVIQSCLVYLSEESVFTDSCSNKESPFVALHSNFSGLLTAGHRFPQLEHPWSPCMQKFSLSAK